MFDLFSSIEGVQIFRLFLKSEFSEENIMFWLAVENFKSTGPLKLAKEASKIFYAYIEAQSASEVTNLGFVVIESICCIAYLLVFNGGFCFRVASMNRRILEAGRRNYPSFLALQVY